MIEYWTGCSKNQPKPQCQPDAKMILSISNYLIYTIYRFLVHLLLKYYLVKYSSIL